MGFRHDQERDSPSPDEKPLRGNAPHTAASARRTRSRYSADRRRQVTKISGSARDAAFEWSRRGKRRSASALPDASESRTELLRESTQSHAPLGQIRVRNPAVEEWFKARCSTRTARDRISTGSLRVEIPAGLGTELAARRRGSGISTRALCASVGIRQPVTFYAWERGLSRPTLPHFHSYLRAIGAVAQEVLPRTPAAPSRLERIWKEQYGGPGQANWCVTDVRLCDLEERDLHWFALREDLSLTPEQSRKARGFRDSRPTTRTSWVCSAFIC